jgi:2-polyprenyl-6-methoxyphenol hydroxylase-like FAD-dependent oxidoreductase
VIAQMPNIDLAFEDAVLLARILDATRSDTPQDIFPRYEELRRPRADSYYNGATKRSEGSKKQKPRESIVRVYLERFSSHFNKSFSYNVFQEKV